MSFINFVTRGSQVGGKGRAIGGIRGFNFVQLIMSVRLVGYTSFFVVIGSVYRSNPSFIFGSVFRRLVSSFSFPFVYAEVVTTGVDTRPTDSQPFDV